MGIGSGSGNGSGSGSDVNAYHGCVGLPRGSKTIMVGSMGASDEVQSFKHRHPVHSQMIGMGKRKVSRYWTAHRSGRARNRTTLRAFPVNL